MLHFEFLVFLADFLSDWYCLVQFAIGQQLGLVLAQGIIILVPISLDCYRGKIQNFRRHSKGLSGEQSAR